LKYLVGWPVTELSNQIFTAPVIPHAAGIKFHIGVGVGVGAGEDFFVLGHPLLIIKGKNNNIISTRKMFIVCFFQKPFF
jgi:hypothetical protein